MTTTNSTDAQLNGERIKRYGKWFTVIINALSAIGITILVVICNKLG